MATRLVERQGQGVLVGGRSVAGGDPDQVGATTGTSDVVPGSLVELVGTVVQTVAADRLVVAARLAVPQRLPLGGGRTTGSGGLWLLAGGGFGCRLGGLGLGSPLPGDAILFGLASGLSGHLALLTKPQLFLFEEACLFDGFGFLGGRRGPKFIASTEDPQRTRGGQIIRGHKTQASGGVRRLGGAGFSTKTRNLGVIRSGLGHIRGRPGFGGGVGTAGYLDEQQRDGESGGEDRHRQAALLPTAVLAGKGARWCWLVVACSVGVTRHRPKGPLVSVQDSVLPYGELATPSVGDIDRW